MRKLPSGRTRRQFARAGRRDVQSFEPPGGTGEPGTSAIIPAVTNARVGNRRNAKTSRLPNYIRRESLEWLTLMLNCSELPWASTRASPDTILPMLHQIKRELISHRIFTQFVQKHIDHDTEHHPQALREWHGEVYDMADNLLHPKKHR
jgi:hypothetical protein